VRFVPLRNEVLIHEEHGEAFLLHVPSGRYFSLNRSGLVVWNAIVAGEDPVVALGRRWPELPHSAREADAEALLARLVAAGLARAASEPPPAESSSQ